MARALALVLLVGCGASETHTAAVDVQATQDAPPAGDMSWIGGGNAMIEVMIRPHRWPEVRDAARSLVAERTMPREIDELLSTATFVDAVALVLRGRFGRNLQGFDPERPILARLFEPTQPISFAQIVEVAKGNVEHALVHHWVFLPATDAVALSASIREGLSRRCQPAGEGLECGFHTVHLLSADDWVVVAIDTDQLPERSRQNDASWALGHPAAMHVRFDKMRELGPYIGATRVDAALNAAVEEYRGVMRTMGVAELLVAHMHLRPELEELDSMVIALSTEPLGFVGAARMTERGAAIQLERGTATASPEAPLVVRTGFDLNAARANFPSFDVGVPYEESPHDFLRNIQDCGWFCFAHGVSLPFTSARMVRVLGALEEAEIAFVVDESLSANEVQLDAELTQFPMPLRQLGQLVPTARLQARRESSHWVAALGFPETPSLEGLAPPGVGIASRAVSSETERTCVARMMIDAIAHLKTIARSEGAEQAGFIQRAAEMRDTLGSQCGDGQLATTEREAVRAALSAIPSAP